MKKSASCITIAALLFCSCCLPGNYYVRIDQNVNVASFEHDIYQVQTWWAKELKAKVELILEDFKMCEY